MSDYRNVYVEDGGQRYRVAFYLVLNKVMIVSRSRYVGAGFGKSEDFGAALKIDGKRAAPIIAKARAELAKLIAAEKENR